MAPHFSFPCVSLSQNLGRREALRKGAKKWAEKVSEAPWFWGVGWFNANLIFRQNPVIGEGWNLISWKRFSNSLRSKTSIVFMGSNYVPKRGAVLGNYICSFVMTPKCTLFSALCSADTWLCRHWPPCCGGLHILSFSACLCQLSGTVLKCHLWNQ